MLKFEPINILASKKISSFTKKYPPYSDFNFSSLFCYNTHNLGQYTFINDNLLLLYTDYIDSSVFLSLLGTNHLEQTLGLIKEYCTHNNINPTLKLVPDFVAQQIKLECKTNYVIKEDFDNHDYLLDLRKLADLGGNKLRGKKNQYNRFVRQYSDLTLIEESSKNVSIKEVRELYSIWATKTTQTWQDIENEYLALLKSIRNMANLPIKISMLYVQKQLVALCIYEEMKPPYSILHFIKANTNFEGAYVYIQSAIARKLLNQNYHILNVEQDLGIPGLRKSKLSWQPCGYLKKYTVKL